MQRHERLIAFTAALLAFAPIVGEAQSPLNPTPQKSSLPVRATGSILMWPASSSHADDQVGVLTVRSFDFVTRVDRLVPSAPGFQFLSDVSGGRVAHTIASATGNRISVADVAGNNWTEISGPRSLGLQSRETWWRSRT